MGAAHSQPNSEWFVVEQEILKQIVKKSQKDERCVVKKNQNY